MVLIIITIILQVVILLAVLHAFKVRKQRGYHMGIPGAEVVFCGKCCGTGSFSGHRLHQDR